MRIYMAMLGGFAAEYQRKIKDRKPQKAGKAQSSIIKAQDGQRLNNCARISGACVSPEEKQITHAKKHSKTAKHSSKAGIVRRRGKLRRVR